jgi:hypothetical protein
VLLLFDGGEGTENFESAILNLRAEIELHFGPSGLVGVLMGGNDLNF